MGLQVYRSIHKDLKNIDIDNPSEDQIRFHFQQLDGDGYVELMLNGDHPEPSLLIRSSREGHFHIVYMYHNAEGEFRVKLLFDRNASKTQEAAFELSNGEIDNYPLYGTVNREIALQTLVYFFNMGDSIPQSELPDGLFWSTRAYIELYID
jgi:hypothetical protein